MWRLQLTICIFIWITKKPIKTTLYMGSYSYGHKFKFHTFLIPKNVNFHTKSAFDIHVVNMEHSLNRVTKWKYRNIPGRLEISTIWILNFYQFQQSSANFSSNCNTNLLAYKSLEPPQKILFHTETLNSILFMTLKNRKLNS